MLSTYATIYGDEELGDTDLQLLQDGRDRSFEAFANGEVGMLIEGDYFWRSVIHPDPEQALFPMENRDEVVGWATIPAYEPGGALGGLDAASMSGGGVWTMNPNTEHAGRGVGAADVHELRRAGDRRPRRAAADHGP